MLAAVRELGGQSAVWVYDPQTKAVTSRKVTVATADALLTDQDFGAAYRRWGNRYRRAGYGKGFRAWLDSDDPQPYGSWGNGSAMRVSPVASFVPPTNPRSPVHAVGGVPRGLP